MNNHASLQCIIMPFKPSSTLEFDGVGLALHFLLGNAVVLNGSLKEMWFGWRVKKLFSDAGQLCDYCKGCHQNFSVDKESSQQNIRFWIYGEYDHCLLNLSLYDAWDKTAVQKSIGFSCPDHLLGLRSGFVEWLRSSGIAWTSREKEASLWHEHCGIRGLDLIGKALKEFYIFSAFGKDKKLDLSPFERAVEKSPGSFMAHDILGWAFYRNNTLGQAKVSFKKALSINPHGAGVMAGLMWCSLKEKKRDKTLYWAESKARASGKNVEKAKETASRLYDRHNNTDHQP